jgi:uncharacterized protein
MRVVIDTNIWISGLLFGGIPSKIILLAQSQQIEIIYSEALLNEIRGVLSYRKFHKRLEKTGLSKQKILDTLQKSAVLVEVNPIPSVASLRDEDDLKVLAAAVGGGAIAIVSGDSDLLVIREFQGILIMTAKDFLDRYFPGD